MKRLKPNIILILMDSVRADHLSLYGYFRKTSPNIDAIARRAVIYENAFSAAEWTIPSHASIFTGKYPSYHKVLGRNMSINEENVTLAEILRWNGYQTIGITNNGLLGAHNGFNRGFQEFVEVFKIRPVSYQWLRHPGSVLRTMMDGPDKGTHRTNELIKHFVKKKKKEPFFLFVNYVNTHFPYDPPRPFKKRFCDYFDESRLYILDLLLKKTLKRTTERFYDPKLNFQKISGLAGGKGNERLSFLANELQVSEKEWNIVKAWYDGEIAYLDYQLGELFNLLCNEGIFDNTFLIITSDHGDNFGEHNLIGHNFCLYDSLLHVPLITVYPDVIPAGKRFLNIASTIDIFPTILDFSHINGYKDDIQGKSLRPFKERSVHDFVCAECGNSIRKLNSKLKRVYRAFKCLRTNTYKYIISSDKKEQLYNIRNDPLEQKDISSEFPNKTEFFRRKLKDTLDISYFGPEETNQVKIREEMLNRLKALGYI